MASESTPNSQSIGTSVSIGHEYLSVTKKESSLALFKFGTTLDELNYCFDNVGHILSVLLESKFDNKFFDILFRLKPIENIDEYMFKLNLDREVALRENKDLASIVQLWIEESQQIKSESQVSLYSVSKTEQFLKLLARNETDYSTFIAKSSNKIRLKNLSHHNIIETSGSGQQPNEIERKENDSVVFESKVLLNIRYKDESKDYTLSEALNLINEVKENYEKHHYASKCYKKCVHLLFAINEDNKNKISRWDPTEEVISEIRLSWSKRLEEENFIKPVIHQNNANITDKKLLAKNIDCKTPKEA